MSLNWIYKIVEKTNFKCSEYKDSYDILYNILKILKKLKEFWICKQNSEPWSFFLIILIF